MDFSGAKPQMSVTNIKTKGQRESYVKNHAGFLPNRSKRLAISRLPGGAAQSPASDDDLAVDQRGESDHGSTGSGLVNGAGSQEPSASDGQPGAVTGRPGRGLALERTVFDKLRLRNMSCQIQELLRQAQQINIHDAPRVTGILVRVIVELVCTEVIKKGVVPGDEHNKLKDKIGKCLMELDPGIKNPSSRDKELEPAWLNSQGSNDIWVQSLHACVHNPQGSPTEGDVRLLSSNFRPLLERLDALVGTFRA
jgi:hypothetical protein